MDRLKTWVSTSAALSLAFATLAGLALVGGATYTLAGHTGPHRSLAVLSAAAVFVAALAGAILTGWVARRGRAFPPDLAVMQDPLTLTPAQARRMSRRFAQAGVRITPSRLRAISGGAVAYDSELVDIEFALIATRPDHHTLLRPSARRRAS